MIYLQLFLSFMKIGLLGFGGGMAIVSLIQTEVERYGWMSATEYLDILAISQMTPGPIGINCATYVGYTATNSILGSITATFAIILPSLIIMLIISRLYLRISDKWANNKIYQWTMVVIRALVIGLIASAAIKLMTPDSFIDYWSWILAAIVFVCTLLPQFIRKPEGPTADNAFQQHLYGTIKTISHPIFLIVFSGICGFCIYGL